MVNVPSPHVLPVKPIDHKHNCLLLPGFLDCVRKACLSQFGNEALNNLKALLLISRKIQDGVGNHVFLKLCVQFALLVHQEDV